MTSNNKFIFGHISYLINRELLNELLTLLKIPSHEYFHGFIIAVHFLDGPATIEKLQLAGGINFKDFVV
jgi:hypothetical protein